MLPGIIAPIGGLSGGTGGGGGGDPHFSSVVLLMGFEGANGSVTSPGFDDESPVAHGTATSDNSLFASVGTAQKKYGVSALHANGDAIWFPNSSDWQFGSGHFTIEMFVRLDVINSQQTLISLWTNGLGTLSWILYLDSSNKLNWATSTTGSDINFDITGTTAAVTGVWKHYAIDFDGLKYRMYIDGVMEGSFATPRTLYNSPNHLTIGGKNNFADCITGWFDELRITKGIARYADDSGFSVPTSAYPRS